MSTPSRRLAGTLLIVLPTVVFGGVSILTLLITTPATATTPFVRTYGGPGTPTPECCLSCR
jgi:hypothetical protein